MELLLIVPLCLDQASTWWVQKPARSLYRALLRSAGRSR